MAKQITYMLMIVFPLLTLVACNGADLVQDDVPVMEDLFAELPSGERMHYLAAGNPNGKPVLFLHGFPSSAHLYRNILHQVCADSDSDYYCLAISLIGFGQSSCPGDGSQVSPLYEVARVEEFISLMDLNDAAVVVHDWGGPIGTAATLRNADRFSHLIILNTMLSFPENRFLENVMGVTRNFFEQPRPLIERIYPEFVASVMQMMTTRRLSQRVLDLYRAPFRQQEEVTPGVAACRVHAGINLFAKAEIDKPLFTEIEQLAADFWADKPTVFFWSSDDLLLGSRSWIGIAAHAGMEALFPQAGTILFPQADHFLQEDQPQAIARELLHFIGVASANDIRVGPPVPGG